MTTVVLGVLWALWPVVALMGGLGFSVLTGIASLLLLPVFFRSVRPRFYFLALIAFFAFVAASVMWSPREQVLVQFDFVKLKFAVRSEMLRVGLQFLALGGLIAAALRMGDEARRMLHRIATAAMVAQLVILIGLTLFENQILDTLRPIVPDTGEGVQNISRNSLILAIAAPSLALGLAQGRTLVQGLAFGLPVIAVTAAILAYRAVNAGLLALAAAAGAALVVRIFPRHGFKLMALGLAAVIMAAPWVVDYLTQGADFATADDSDNSYRAAIWQRVIVLINEHPVMGGGLGVLRTVRETIDNGFFAGQFTIPNHSHNMLLQLWAEVGAVGAGLLSLAILLVGFRMPDVRKTGIAGYRAAALVGGMTAVACVSFDLWNDWWWAAGGIVAVLAVATPAVRARTAEVETGMTFGEAAAPSPETATIAPAPLPAAHTSNNFNLLRLLFALMVVVYHAIALSHLAGTSQAEAWTSIGAEIGVQGFFVLSGYLVWASLERSQGIGLYAEKRARRLLPGYVVVILVSAFAAVALIPEARVDLAAVGRYLGWNLAFLNFMEPNLPGVFATHHFTEVNGALWTLKIEVMFYLILPILAWLLKQFGTRRWIAFAAIYVGAEVWRAVLAQAGAAQGGMMGELARQLPGQMSFFITGIALCAWRDEINWRTLIAPLGLVLLVVSIAFPQLIALRAAGLGIVAVWLAVGVPRLFDAAKFGDLSYGLYIVHFPIIQTVIAAGMFATPAIGFAAAGAASLVAALLLWWLVERPALRRDSAYRAPQAAANV